jgi:hypothetical protein
VPSFTVAERWVRDPSKPEVIRFRAFLWALESYCWLTGQRFHQTYYRLGYHLGFDWDEKPNSTTLIAALDVLKEEREAMKRKREEFRQLRRRQKALGRRQPDRVLAAALFVPDFLVLPHPAQPRTRQ